MRWLLAAFLLVCASGAQAQLKAPVPNPILHLDFTKSTNLDGRVYINRYTAKYDFTCQTGTPILTTFAAGTASTGTCDLTGRPLGLRLEGTAQMQSTQPSNLTTGWTRTNTTATFNQVGLNGQANSATLVTASSTDGTICQNVAGASSANRVLSMYMKRSAGTGAISVSADNGASYTAVDSYINSTTWTRVPPGGLSELTGGGTNTATVCIKIGTSGDAVIVDGVNYIFAPGATNPYVNPSSVMQNVTVVNTIRQVDYAWLDLTKVPGWNSDSFTAVFKTMVPVWVLRDASVAQAIAQFDDGTGKTFAYLTLSLDPTSNSNCNGGSGNPLYCPDYSWIPSTVDGVTQSPAGKVRGTWTANPSQANILKGLVPPVAGYVATVAISYDKFQGSGISVNNGAPQQTLSTGLVLPIGASPTQPVTNGVSFSPPLPAQAFRRLFLGNNPHEYTTVTGTFSAGNTLTAAATWESPPGTTQTASATYTVVGGDTATTAAAGLAAAITANGTFSAAGISATSSGAKVFPAHGISINPVWTYTSSGGPTYTSAGCGCSLYGYILSVDLYPKAVFGSQLQALSAR